MAEGKRKPFIMLQLSLWRDKRLTGNEKLVLISLLCHYNTEKRRAWPSLNTIAEECVCSRVVVWQTLKTLETKGFIKCKKTAGKVTQYELTFDGIPVQNFNRYTHSESEQVEHTTHSESEPVNSIPIQNLNGGYSESERVPIQNLNTTHSESEPELYLRTRSIRTRSKEQEKQSDFSADFEILWSSYPRKVRKVDARKKYDALRKRGISADELLTAAKNYADQRRGQDEKYTLHCATFLGNERWKDYLLPTVNASARGMLRPRTNEEFVAEQEFINKEFGGDMHEYICWLSDGKPELADWRTKHNGERSEINRGDHRDHATGTGEARQVSIFDI